jgi:hypothetical protein
MGAVVNRSPAERFDAGHPWRVVARGLLHQPTGLWIGAHPGFTDVITDTGVGNQTVHLSAPGAATMFARVSCMNAAGAADAQVPRAAPLAGGTLQDLVIQCSTFDGADSNPGGAGGWNAGAAAVLGAPIAADGIIWIEVIDTAV